MSNSRKKHRGKRAVIHRDELVVKPRPNADPITPSVPVPTPAPVLPAPKERVSSNGPPQSLGELGERVKRSLFGLIDGLCALPMDVVYGAREIVQKIPKYVPEVIKSALVTPRIAEAIAKRIERADEKEAAAQVLAATTGTVPTNTDAQEKLAIILAQLQAKGLHIEIVDVEGVPTIIAVRPELAEAARVLATTAIEAVPAALTTGAGEP